MSTTFSPDILASRALDQAAATLRDFAGSTGSLATIELLNRLEAVYLYDLRNVKPEGLVPLQAQLRQLEALRAVLRGATSSNGRA